MSRRPRTRHRRWWDRFRPGHPERAARRQVLNLRWLGAPLCLAVLAVPALWGWHRWQMSRMADWLAVAAGRAEQAGRWSEAEYRLRTYLRLRPGDPAALTRLARSVDHQATTPRQRAWAAHLYAVAVDANPTDPALRLRLGELRLEADPEFALAAAEAVLEANPRAAGGWRLKARACDRLTERPGAQGAVFRRAIEAYQELVEREPENLLVVLRLATLLHRAAQHRDARPVRFATPEAALDAARQLVDGAVEKKPQALEPRLLRYSYRRLHEPGVQTPPHLAQPRLDSDLAAALRIAPDNVEVLLAVAESYVPLTVELELPPLDSLPAIHPARLTECRRYLEEAVRCAPTDPRPALALAQWHALAGSPQAMADVLAKAEQHVPPGVWLFSARGAELLLWAEQWSAAGERLDRWIDRLGASARQATPAPAQWRVLANLLRARRCLAERNPGRRPAAGLAHLEAAAALARRERASAAVWGEVGRARFLAGQIDLAIAAYRQALEQSPEATALRLGLARGLVAAGRWEEANQQFRRALGPPVPNPWAITGTAWRELAESCLRLQASRSVAERTWDEFDQAFAQAAELARGDYRLALVLVESRLYRTAIDRAQWLTEVRTLARVFRQNPKFWRDLASLLDRVGEPEAAREAVERSEALAGDEALAPILLADASEGEDSVERAGYAQWLDEIERALAEGDLPRLQWCAARLRELGAEGTSLADFATLRGELARARTGERAALDRAQELARSLVASRPDWPLAEAGQAQVAELRGDWTRAQQGYRQAWKLGDRRLALARKLIGLGLLARDPVLVATTWDQLPPASRLKPEVLPLGIRMLIERGEFDSALALIDAALVRQPGEVALELLRGRVLWRRGGPRDAAAAAEHFESLIERHPNSLAAWLTWAAFMSETLEGSSSDRALAGWRAVRVWGRLACEDQALWRQLVAGIGADLDGRFAEAEEALRRVAALEDGALQSVFDQCSVFRTDALVPDAPAAHSPAVPQSSLAQKLVWLSTGEDEPAAADHPRLRALARLLDGGPVARREARELLSSLPSDAQGPGDRLVLAQLSLLGGDTEEAARLLKSLIDAPRNSGPPQRGQLLTAAEWATAAGLADAAEALLEALEAAGGGFPRAEFLRLQCAVAGGRASDTARWAAQQLLDIGQGQPPPAWGAQRVVEIAGLWARIDPAAAEQGVEDAARWLPPEQRCQLRWWTTRPDGGPRLVQALDEAAGAERLALAELCCQWLLTAETQTAGYAELNRRVSDLVDATERSADPPPIGLWASWAVLLDQQGRPDEALRLTERALAQDPANPVLWNNRAWIEATHLSLADRARATLAEATRLAGPLPAFVDTLSVAELSAGLAELAAGWSESIVLRPGAPGGWWLHLAEAYAALGEDRDARLALEVARSRGLRPLPPRDQAALERLQSHLAVESSPGPRES